MLLERICLPAPLFDASSPNPPLKHPVVVYTGVTNMDAQMAERFLASKGVPAYAVEDHSLGGYWLGGTISNIHKPQVWVDKSDLDRATEMIEEFKAQKKAADAERKRHEPQTLAATCEDCENIDVRRVAQRHRADVPALRGVYGCRGV